jgi:drug/metabolite transporter (DMT)-like permease
MGITRVVNSKAGSNRLISFSIFTPRIWKIMIVAAYPSLLLATNYFEALERTGAMGAFIADTLMPVTMICYVVLIFVLKKAPSEHG